MLYLRSRDCCTYKQVLQFENKKEAKEFLRNDNFYQGSLDKFLYHSDFYYCYGGFKEAKEYLNKGWHGRFLAGGRWWGGDND